MPAAPRAASASLSSRLVSSNARNEGYSRRHRFAARGSFGPVLRSSRKIRGRYAVLHVMPGRPGISRFGIAVAKRLVPLSVDRNGFKRTAREIFRRHPLRGLGLDCVLAMREKLVGVEASALAADIAEMMDRASGAAAR
jgi:ribonuclease P protein component